jgi:dTDP-4-amino-4,6-dideoxygalactose transaminase
VPTDRPSEFAVYHTFVIQAEHRDALRIHLEHEGIGTRVHYPRPIHRTTIGATLGYGPGSFPIAERAAHRILSLPVYPELTRAQLDHVVGAIRDFYRERREA